MNRVVATVAACALLLLLISGAWLILNPAGKPHRSVGHSNDSSPHIADRRESVSGPAQNDPAPSVNAPAPARSDPKTEEPRSAKPRPALPDPARTTENETRRTIAVTVSGEVLDPANAAANGATIWLETAAWRKHKAFADEDSRDLHRVAATDSAGRFTFSFEQDVFDSAALTLYVSATLAGCAPADPVAVNGSRGGHFNVSLVLRKSGAATGRVVDMQGNGVSGVRVALGKAPPQADRPARRHEYMEVVTDSHGRYEFTDVPHGARSVGVVSAILNTREGPTVVRIAEGTTKLADIVVERVTSLRMHFVDADGKGVHGPLVLLYSLDGKVKQRMTAFVAGNGLVEIAYPPVGSFEVAMQLEGYLEIPPRALRIEYGATADLGEIVVRRDPGYVRQR